MTYAAGAVETTRIGFGCAGLMRASARADREAVLRAAYDAGIRHFDVARMYGLGAAEQELGRFAQGRRDSLVIATKFGIDPPAGSKRLAALQGPARRLLAWSPALRQRIKNRAGAVHPVSVYDAATARASLETSLRELSTDYVDLLLLHAPTPDRVRTEDVCSFLEGARQAGMIRAWGVSGEPEPTTAVLAGFPPAAVKQIHDDLLTRKESPAVSAAPMLTFGALAGPLDVLRGHLAAEASRIRAWSAAIGEDCGQPEVLASLLMRDAVRVNRHGTVLFATSRPGHVQVPVRAAAGAGQEDPALEAFRECISKELTAC